MRIQSGSFHTSAGSATKMPGRSHSPAPGGPFRAGDEGPPETRCRLKGPYGGLKVDRASVTVGQHGRRPGVITAFVTRPDSRHGALPSRFRPRSSTSRTPAPLATATACPGRGERGAPLPGRQLAWPHPFPLHRLLALAATALIGLLGAAFAGAAPAGAAPAPDPYRLTPELAHVAHVVAPTRALARPGKGRTVMKVSPLAEWGGGRVQYLVLRSATVDGSRWLRVRLPQRPNSAAGWISADVTRVSTTPWRIVVSTGAALITVERAGRPVVSFPAVVGKPSTPTPRGLFAVDELIRQPAGSELGPWALFLTAHSRVLDDYGGGPGRIAIHGRAGPLLAAPLGTAGSHGCIRIANARIRWLARIAINGTPVQVTH